MPAESVWKSVEKQRAIGLENDTQSSREWAHATWNPYVGCRKVSPGCAHCYMFRDQMKYGHDPAQVRRTADATFYAPLRRKQPHVIFTCSWSDFFIEEADKWRDDVWDVIRRTPHHIYQVLTKRPERMQDCLPRDWGDGWPHVWLGVTAENQRAADRRLPLLLETPTTMRWVCAEPLLGPLDLSAYLGIVWNDDDQKWVAHSAAKNTGCTTRLDWIVTGAETGPDARPMNEEWVRALRDQCVAAGVPFCYKQNAVDGRRINSPRLDGRIWNEMPVLPPPMWPAPMEQKRADSAPVQLALFDE
jgi:protein gp37